MTSIPNCAYGPGSYIKVIGSRSRSMSQKQKSYVSRSRVACLRLKGNLVFQSIDIVLRSGVTTKCTVFPTLSGCSPVCDPYPCSQIYEIPTGYTNTGVIFDATVTRTVKRRPRTVTGSTCYCLMTGHSDDRTLPSSSPCSCQVSEH